jgi:heme exporter protein B
MQAVLRLILNEYRLELRRKSVMASIGLYVFSLVFICYLTFKLNQGVLGPVTWAALFWLVLLFSIINSVAKSFIAEKKGVIIYYYSIASPQAIISSKILYNSFLSLILSLGSYLLFALFISNPIADTGLFLLTIFLSSTGFATSLTLLSGIAAKASNSNILMAVLSFPVVISILLMAIRVTKNALDGIDRSASADELLNLLAINCISAALAYLLFPYIWRS